MIVWWRPLFESPEDDHKVETTVAKFERESGTYKVVRSVFVFFRRYVILQNLVHLLGVARVSGRELM